LVGGLMVQQRGHCKIDHCKQRQPLLRQPQTQALPLTPHHTISASAASKPVFETFLRDVSNLIHSRPHQTHLC
jgi:hypothetical protein